MKLTAFCRWFDLWIGAFVDVPHQALYVCPVPMLGLKFSWAMAHNMTTVQDSGVTDADCTEFDLPLYGYGTKDEALVLHDVLLQYLDKHCIDTNSATLQRDMTFRISGTTLYEYEIIHFIQSGRIEVHARRQWTKVQTKWHQLIYSATARTVVCFRPGPWVAAIQEDLQENFKPFLESV